MSTTLDVTLKVLYVQGPAGDVDRAATEQLRKASAELQITTIAGSPAALAELRRTPGWQALFASPSLPQNEVLALVASLRRDRIPIAIVPILDDAHQDLFASAVAAGADDVLVRRGSTLVNINETLTRIRQSPHLFPAEHRRRISVLYAGRDPLVWNLLDQVPFVKADRVATGIDGTCSVRRPGSGDDRMRADAVIIDEAPGDAHPLQVLKSVKAQASDLPVIMLTSAGAADIATAALELGADDTVLKTGIFRRRLIATLRRVHQRLEMSAQQQETRTREERLRQIVENVPTGIMVVAGDARVLAMNAAALHVFGASRPRDVVGRDFRDLVTDEARDAITDLIHRVTKGEADGLTFSARAIGGDSLQARIDAVVLERDARGGRGLVASITRAGVAATDNGADERSAAELAELRDALQTLERHYAELEDARGQERAVWESERQKLEARVADAERLAAERQTIQERLGEVSGELARTSQSFADERHTLERRLAELEDAAHEASAIGASRAVLESALEAVREEQRQAIAAHALERSGWQDIRSELETRVQQLDSLHQSEHDTLVASLKQDVQRLETSLAEEHARWDTTRDQLEAELRNAREALWAEHTERDAARARFDAEQDELRRTLETERTAWQDARAQLEQDLAGARAAAEAGDVERDQVRAQLDEQLQAAHAALEAERRDWQASRDTLEDARRRVEASLEHERAEWAEQRLALEDERRQLVESGVQAGDLAAEQSRLSAELDVVREQSAAERVALEAEVAAGRIRAEQADEALQTTTREFDATRARLEQERDDIRTELDAARAAHEARLAELDSDIAGARDLAATISAERDGLRQQLTLEQSALEEARTAERADWQQRLMDLEGALASATDTATKQDADWQQERSALQQAASDARTWAEQERGHLVSLHAREIEDWRHAVEQARSERDLAASRISTVETEIEETRRQLVELDYVRAALDVAKADQDQANGRATALEGELDILRGALDTARGDHDHAQQRIVSLQSELAGTRDRIATLEADLEQTRQQLGELNHLRATLDTARGDHDHAHDRAVALESELAGTRDRVATLEADLEQTRQQLGQLDHLRATLDTARNDHDHAHNRAVALESELAGTRDRVASLEADLEQTRQQLGQLDHLRATLDTARGDHDQAHNRAVALESDLAGTRDRVATLEADLEQTRQQLGELDHLRATLDTARADHDHAHNRAVALESELAGTRDRIATLEADLEQTRQQLGELDHLRATLDTARADHNHAHNRALALESELAGTRDRIASLEADLEQTRQQLGQLDVLRTTVEAARGGYDEAQARIGLLEQDLASSRALADEHQKLVESLEAARNEIRHTDAAHHVEREEWQRSRLTLERELSEIDTRHRRERDEWDHLRAQLEDEAAEASRLAREQQFLNNTIVSLQAECSALSGSLDDERIDHERLRHELDSLRAELDDSRTRMAEVDAALDRAAQSADRQLADQLDRHEARERQLEADLRGLSARLAAAVADADQERMAMHADRIRALDAHARLVSSDTFGYAVTSPDGHLLRCNNAFARLFGYADAGDATTRTSSRPFPGLANRPDMAARLAADGRLDRVVSCVERVDGRAVRIIETAVRLDQPGDTDDRAFIVEHLIVAGPAGPTPEDRQHRRLEEVGTLASAMMAELEPLSAAAEARSVELVRLAEARRVLTAESAEVRAAAERVASLVRQLAGFSRRQRREPEPIDLGQMVLDAEPMLSRLVGDYIAFTMNLGATTPVDAQPDDVQQLLTSLVTLGRDLLPTGGTVVVDVHQEESTGGLGVPGPVLAVKASGYGAQFPGAVAALELVAGRCGGTVRISGDTGRLVRLEVFFPRCGNR